LDDLLGCLDGKLSNHLSLFFNFLHLGVLAGEWWVT
jgi:hypothetical protein